MEQIEKIKKAIVPLRQEIVNHKVYSAIKDINDLKVFMQYHVYAVWDFMSLLKTLQNNLTCTSVPWFPKGSAETRYLINEIVVGEESDVDLNGIRKSHFELYLDAMEQCGAETSQIRSFIEVLSKTGDFNAAFAASDTPKEAQDFVGFTFKIIDSNKDYLQSAIFTFGREDLIPGMFVSIIIDIHNTFPDSIAIFKYYLERHIEVDGDHHSHLALQMTSNLCGSNQEFWEEVEKATKDSLQKRIDLWDGAYNKIMARTNTALDTQQRLFEKHCHTFYMHKKEYGGFPPDEYRMEGRTTRVPYFLEKGTFSTVLKVAYAMGFKQSNDFTKKFKERYEKAPLVFFKLGNP